MQTTAAVRQQNRKRVLHEIFREGSISRVGLVNATGLTGTAITRITRELIDVGLVEESDRQTRKDVPGRRETGLFISERVAHVIAVSLHIDDRSIVLADIRGNIKDRVDLDISFSANQSNVIDQVGTLALKLVERNHLSLDQVLGLAISVAGKIDPLEGVLVESRVYGWKNVPIRQILQQRTGLPIVIENLNNSINLSETRFGIARGRRNVLLVRVGTGLLGASLIIDGHLLRGYKSGAGLIHHLPIGASNRLCECGRRGCLNTVSSGLGVLACYENTEPVVLESGDSPGSNARIVDLIQAAEDGDAAASTILMEGGEKLCGALMLIAETLCPEVILVAGKVGRSRHYFGGLRNRWEQQSNRDQRANVELLLTQKSVLEATIDLSIDSFLLSADLDLEQLKRLHDSGRAA